MNALTALSPLDGRYASKCDALRPFLSEFGLIHARVTVEVRWLQALANRPEITEVPAFSAATNAALDAIVADFSEDDANKVIEYVKTLAPRIILVCHVKDVLLEKAGAEFTASDLDLTGKIKSTSGRR